ncbi:MAG: hypothetical protein ACRD8W_13770 [Nitrososphaeraceae archaeon]
MKVNATSERHQNNNLKAGIAFAEFLGSETTFYQISTKDQVTNFLDKKIRSNTDDPEQRWITTWNDYLVRIKHFFRGLHNCSLVLDDIDSKIIEYHIGRSFNKLPMSSSRLIYDKLKLLVYDASSKEKPESIQDFRAFVLNTEREFKNEIEGKRITKEKVGKIISHVIASDNKMSITRNSQEI